METEKGGFDETLLEEVDMVYCISKCSSSLFIKKRSSSQRIVPPSGTTQCDVSIHSGPLWVSDNAQNCHIRQVNGPLILGSNNRDIVIDSVNGPVYGGGGAQNVTIRNPTDAAFLTYAPACCNQGVVCPAEAQGNLCSNSTATWQSFWNS